MHGDVDRTRVLNRRVVFLGVGKAVLLSTLIGRLYFLQVLEADRYKLLSDENQFNIYPLAPPRGRIVDRLGTPLAVNAQNFQAQVVLEVARDLNRVLDAISAIYPLSEHDRQRIRREAEHRRRFMPVTVAENLSWEQMARLQVNAPDLPGLVISQGLTRNYPLRELGAHILGYVSSVSEDDESDDPLMDLPGFRIGKAGVERTHDLALRGRGGTYTVEVNAVGRIMKEHDRQEGEPGAEVRLSLDIRLQKFAAERLGEESGAVVVMDIHTGEVVLMASSPSFDPNAFSRGLNAQEWKDLITNPRSPLTNKVIAGQYAPGSTFKMMVALAALEAGVATPDTRVSCPGFYNLGNARFHCWKKGGHGSLDMVSGIMHSCDVYFYEMSHRVGIDRIADMARRFGMGSRLGIELPGERPGLIPDRRWKKANMRESWQAGETLVAGIGQGFMLATPLQLCTMVARIANGGFATTPHLTIHPADPHLVKPSNLSTVGVADKHLEVVRRGMYSVSNIPGGTAYASRVMLPGLQMSGKTGTSQVRRISAQERATGVRKNEDLPWLERDNALFVAYAPESSPRYAIAVIVEHGGSGSKAAAPIARDIMTEVLKLDPAGENERIASRERKGGEG
ncbi:MAG: penicillin-binding protein 2 [Alphaproteobacteria bacterium]|nr:penicillin-binding protein 2 [Alphaproteobacteria bacterium]